MQLNTKNKYKRGQKEKVYFVVKHTDIRYREPFICFEYMVGNQVVAKILVMVSELKHHAKTYLTNSSLFYPSL